jgi:hypothetical protein
MLWTLMVELCCLSYAMYCGVVYTTVVETCSAEYNEHIKIKFCRVYSKIKQYCY